MITAMIMLGIVGILFSLQAVSAYNYNVTSDFSGCLAGCLEWIEGIYGSDDQCSISGGDFMIEDCTNITMLVRIEGNDANSEVADTMVSNVRPNDNFGGSGHYMYISGGSETFRPLIKIDDAFLNNKKLMLNNTVNAYSLWLYEYDTTITNPQKGEVWKITDANRWEEFIATWNNRTISGWTCTASAEAGGNPCTNAIDNNEATYWNANDLAPQWLDINLGASTEVINITISCEGAAGGHYGNIILKDIYGNILDSREYANAGSPCVGGSPITLNYSPAIVGVYHVYEDALGGGDWVADREFYVNGNANPGAVEITHPPWAGSAGVNTSGIDYLAGENYTRNFSVGESSGYVNWSLNTSWLGMELEGNNTGLKVKMAVDELGSETGFVRFETAQTGGHKPYFLVNISGVNITAKEQYNISAKGAYVGIEVASSDVSLDCNNVKLFGLAGASKGIYYYRKGGNVTVKNCRGENFNNYAIFSIDTYSDPVNDYVYNLTGWNGMIQFVGEYALAEAITVYNGYFNILEYASNDNVSTYNNFICYNCSNQVNIDQVDYAIITNWLIYSNHSNSILWTGSSDYNNLTNFRLYGNGISDKGIEMLSGGNNIFDNFTISDINGTCFGPTGEYSNVLKNSAITNCIKGMEITNVIFNLQNTNITNSSQECIELNSGAVGNSYGTIINNTLINCGNSSQTAQFLKSQSPKCYAATCFDQYFSLMLSANLGSLIFIDSNDKDVSSIAIGSNDFDLWLLDLPGAGLPLITAYAEDQAVLDCATLAAIYGGTCYLDEDKYYIGNGANNYSIKPVAGLTVQTGYTDPPYMRYLAVFTQDDYPLYVDLDNSCNVTMSGNVLYNDDGRITYNQAFIDAGATGVLSEIYHNHFDIANASITLTGTDYTACKDSAEGNFYEEIITPITGDCGQMTHLNNASWRRTVILNATNQSHRADIPITYHLRSCEGNETAQSSDPNIRAIIQPNCGYATMVPNDGRVNGTALQVFLGGLTWSERLEVYTDRAEVRQAVGHANRLQITGEEAII